MRQENYATDRVPLEAFYISSVLSTLFWSSLMAALCYASCCVCKRTGLQLNDLNRRRDVHSHGHIPYVREWHGSLNRDSDNIDTTEAELGNRF